MFHDFDEYSFKEEMLEEKRIEYYDIESMMMFKNEMDSFLLKLYRRRCSNEENSMIDSLLLEGCPVSTILAVVNDSQTEENYKEIVLEYRRFQENIASTFMDMLLMDVDIPNMADIYYELVNNTSVKGVIKEDDQELLKLNLKYKKVLRKVKKTTK